MATLLPNNLVQFEPETVTNFLNTIVNEIQQKNIARTIIPHVLDLNVEDTDFEYFSTVSDNAIKYESDLGSYPDNAMALKKLRASAPLLFTRYSIPFLEARRIDKSVIPRNTRSNNVIRKFANWQEGIAIAGTSKFGTSFQDTTNNTTAMSGAANLTTEALLKTTYENIVSELEDNFTNSSYGSGSLTGYPIIMLVTTDVYRKLRSTYFTYSDKYTYLDFVNEKLRAESGVSTSGVFPSKYLGATFAIDENGKTSLTAGTTNIAAYLWDPMHFAIHESEFLSEAFDGNTEQPFRLNMMTRYTRPEFMVQEAFLYQDTVTIA